MPPANRRDGSAGPPASDRWRGGRASAREGSHSLGGHGLLLEGDEGHPQRPLLDPALLLRDPLGQPVLQARVVSDGVLLPADTPPR